MNLQETFAHACAYSALSRQGSKMAGQVFIAAMDEASKGDWHARLESLYYEMCSDDRSKPPDYYEVMIEIVDAFVRYQCETGEAMAWIWPETSE